MVTELSYDTESTRLVCLTSGGPVTNVTWTQDGNVLAEDGDTTTTHQQLLDTSGGVALYRNMLQLSRDTESDNVGVYRCQVSNNRGSTSRDLSVAGKYHYRGTDCIEDVASE